MPRAGVDRLSGVNGPLIQLRMIARLRVTNCVYPHSEAEKVYMYINSNSSNSFAPFIHFPVYFKLQMTV